MSGYVTVEQHAALQAQLILTNDRAMKLLDKIDELHSEVQALKQNTSTASCAHQKPREWWIVDEEDGIFSTYPSLSDARECALPTEPIIRVREVLE